MQIHQISNQKKVRKRIGRGGKKGTYSGRGSKGQKARSGFSKRATFEGGASGIVAHTKKLRGFKQVKKLKQVVSLERINQKFEEGEVVNPKNLKSKGLIESAKGKVKILSDGELKKKIKFEKVTVSKAALDKITQSGSEIEAAS